MNKIKILSLSFFAVFFAAVSTQAVTYHNVNVKLVNCKDMLSEKCRIVVTYTDLEEGPQTRPITKKNLRGVLSGEGFALKIAPYGNKVKIEDPTSAFFKFKTQENQKMLQKWGSGDMAKLALQLYRDANDGRLPYIATPKAVAIRTEENLLDFETFIEWFGEDKPKASAITLNRPITVIVATNNLLIRTAKNKKEEEDEYKFLKLNGKFVKRPGKYSGIIKIETINPIGFIGEWKLNSGEKISNFGVLISASSLSARSDKQAANVASDLGLPEKAKLLIFEVEKGLTPKLLSSCLSRIIPRNITVTGDGKINKVYSSINRQWAKFIKTDDKQKGLIPFYLKMSEGSKSGDFYPKQIIICPLENEVKTAGKADKRAQSVESLQLKPIIGELLEDFIKILKGYGSKEYGIILSDYKEIIEKRLKKSESLKSLKEVNSNQIKKLFKIWFLTLNDEEREDINSEVDDIRSYPGRSSSEDKKQGLYNKLLSDWSNWLETDFKQRALMERESDRRNRKILEQYE